MKRLVLIIFVLVVALAVWVLRWRESSEPAVPAPGANVKWSDPDVPIRAPQGVIRPGSRAPLASPPSARPLPPPQGPEAPQLPSGSTQKDRIPGEYVLGFFSWQESDAFARAAAEQGIEILDRMALGNTLRIRTTDEALLSRLIAEVSRPSHFDYNYYVRLPPPPPMDDKRAPESGYMGFGPNALTWLGVGLENADWGKGVRVAVLDTAVQRHSALPEDVVSRFEVDGGMTAAGGGGSGHGTAVASIIVGEAAGLRGIAPAAEIVSIPVVSAEGKGDAFTLARGVVEAVTLGASVINLSLGSYGDSEILYDAVDYALRNDVAVVASTGNDALRGVMYPARYEGVIAVGAVDAEYQHVYFSNRGDEVDLTAPGIAVTAAGPDNQVGLFSGTSAATPFVSGALAAVLSGNPGMSPSEAAELLIVNAEDRGAPGRDEEYGAGVLDLRRVMEQGAE